MAPGGYAWWYVDALSDDGRHALAIIGFLGSVFSPYYARARRRGAPQGADPADHCALNVALYGESTGSHRWAMTERGRGHLQRDASTLAIGPSAMRWESDALVIDIDEVTVPLPRRLRGKLRVQPRALAGQSFELDGGGLHSWRPIAPSARVEVEMTEPALRWRGEGYFDSNIGQRPLEADFMRWNWSRAALADGGTAVLYDVAGRRDDALSLALRFDRMGGSEPFDAPAVTALPPAGWRMQRATRCEEPGTPRVLRTLEDSPFYSRSLIESHLLGQRVRAVHESLSLERWSRPWCQWMLPFRMPRRA